jgi:hypothetical protein
MCLRVGDLDGVQEEHKRFILIRTEEYRKGSLVLSCTDVRVVGGYKLVREGGAPRSQNVSGVCVFASDESNGLWICLLSP